MVGWTRYHNTFGLALLVHQTRPLLDYGFDKFKGVNIQSSNYVESVPVYDGIEHIGNATLSMVKSTTISVPADVNEATDIRVESDVPTTINTAISTGDIMGTASMFLKDQPIVDVEMIVTDIEYFKIETEEAIEMDDEKDTDNTNSKKPLLFIPVIAVMAVYVLYRFDSRRRRIRRYKRYEERRRNRF